MRSELYIKSDSDNKVADWRTLLLECLTGIKAEHKSQFADAYCRHIESLIKPLKDGNKAVTFFLPFDNGEDNLTKPFGKAFIARSYTEALRIAKEVL